MMHESLPVVYYLHNFCTGRIDARTSFPTTDEEVRCYISQDETAQALYSLYREAGKSVREAMEGTLLAVIGENPGLLKQQHAPLPHTARSSSQGDELTSRHEERPTHESY